MLKSLKINNYRNLKDFKINTLCQINLITGKNNTGKSTVLEAIAIYVSQGDCQQLLSLLKKRGEDYSIQSDKMPPLEANIKSFSSLFTDRKVSFDESDSIFIGEQEESPEKSTTLRFIKYTTQETQEGGRKIKFHPSDASETEYPDIETGFEIRAHNNFSFLPINQRISEHATHGKPYILQFVNTGDMDRNINEKLFDKVALTEKEQFVIEALRVIEPTTERIAFVGGMAGERMAVIKLSGNKDILPLQSMGDGMNRILTIILALVNASDGYLLIDEFENGLHYTTQSQIWEIIFKLAKQLNIQVFASTHSNDCISGFEKALNKPHNSVSGKLIRLDNKNGTIKEVEFLADELKIAES
jgi:AAA15 family ATPase/GTPase